MYISAVKRDCYFPGFAGVFVVSMGTCLIYKYPPILKKHFFKFSGPQKIIPSLHYTYYAHEKQVKMRIMHMENNEKVSWFIICI